MSGASGATGASVLLHVEEESKEGAGHVGHFLRGKVNLCPVREEQCRVQGREARRLPATANLVPSQEDHSGGSGASGGSSALVPVAAQGEPRGGRESKRHPMPALQQPA